VIGSRREARETALGLLYEADVRGETPAETVARQIIPPVEYARVLLAGVAEHCVEIDDLLRSVSHGWAIERMAVIDRALLRLSTYELAHRPDVPTGAVLSEAVELAKRYGTDDSSRFVNGVLGTLAREIRPDSA
jgi:transcription antitermination protein NusB